MHEQPHRAALDLGDRLLNVSNAISAPLTVQSTPDKPWAHVCFRARLLLIVPVAAAHLLSQIPHCTSSQPLWTSLGKRASHFMMRQTLLWACTLLPGLYAQSLDLSMRTNQKVSRHQTCGGKKEYMCKSQLRRCLATRTNAALQVEELVTETTVLSKYTAQRACWAKTNTTT
jgi:hypothetical protein